MEDPKRTKANGNKGTRNITTIGKDKQKDSKNKRLKFHLRRPERILQNPRNLLNFCNSLMKTKAYKE